MVHPSVDSVAPFPFLGPAEGEITPHSTHTHRQTENRTKTLFLLVNSLIKQNNLIDDDGGRLKVTTILK